MSKKKNELTNIEVVKNEQYEHKYAHVSCYTYNTRCYKLLKGT